MKVVSVNRGGRVEEVLVVVVVVLVEGSLAD